jgi:hypothetical protein
MRATSKAFVLSLLFSTTKDRKVCVNPRYTRYSSTKLSVEAMLDFIGSTPLLPAVQALHWGVTSTAQYTTAQYTTVKYSSM